MHTDPKLVDVGVAEEIIQNISQIDNSSISITIPPEVFNSSVLHYEEEIAIVFAEYDSSALYPLPPNSALIADENASFSVASTLLTDCRCSALSATSVCILGQACCRYNLHVTCCSKH